MGLFSVEETATGFNEPRPDYKETMSHDSCDFLTSPPEKKKLLPSATYRIKFKLIIT